MVKTLDKTTANILLLVNFLLVKAFLACDLLSVGQFLLFNEVVVKVFELFQEVPVAIQVVPHFNAGVVAFFVLVQ